MDQSARRDDDTVSFEMNTYLKSTKKKVVCPSFADFLYRSETASGKKGPSPTIPSAELALWLPRLVGKSVDPVSPYILPSIEEKRQGAMQHAVASMHFYTRPLIPVFSHVRSTAHPALSSTNKKREK